MKPASIARSMIPLSLILSPSPRFVILSEAKDLLLVVRYREGRFLAALGMTGDFSE